MLEDVWNARDLPVLMAIARHLDQNPGTALPVKDLVEHLDMGPDDITRAVVALSDAGYIETIVHDRRLASAGRQINRVKRISPEARRIVGLWPSPETALDRMIAALEELAAKSESDETRGKAQKLLDGFAEAGRQIGVGVARAAITGSMGL
jgi:DNA-binding MarR family transcriptional regulator